MALQDSIEQLQNIDLSDLDFSNIGSWPGALKVILMVLVALVIGFVGYSLYLSEKLDMLEAAEIREQELRTEYETKAADAANLDAYLKQKAQMEETFGTLLRQLPKETEVPGLLEDITRTAIDNELTIESITLKPEQTTEFYVELPIDIVVEGDFHKIGSFVSSVANLPRIVTLHNFKVDPVSSASHLKMVVEAKTYRYLEEGGQ